MKEDRMMNKTKTDERQPAYRCAEGCEVDDEVIMMVKQLQQQCHQWDRNRVRAKNGIKTMMLVVVAIFTYSVLPDFECQYVLGHDALRPAMVCNHLTNTLHLC
ncbi:MAG: hypothetical protein J6V54_10360 [Bacteroidales bacterium]|nr:hypothetical protein [Bacteroidales bacterium]